MSKKMLVNATHPEENRVAIVENGLLTELDIEVAGREPTKGNIYKAVIVRVETGLQAAFVDYGAERLGFLQIDEINYATVKPEYKAEESRRPRINDLLHRGQEILVQITKEERGTKGAALTTYLSLAGRYMVLMPDSPTRGVSRKAESDAQRKELKKAMSSIDLAEGIGYIVRTAALDQSREELERDYRYLIRLFESIKALAQRAKAPALIYKESNLMIRSIRDYFTTDMDEVLIDDPQVFKEAREFFEMVMPDHVNLVKLHQERRPIFSRYQIEDQIETLSRNKITLPSGGSIVIDPTEALVAIDVNSGKMSSEQNVEATATKTNLEAAEEVGRQLRLRDLGGLIVIDFIDMRDRKHMRQVENQLKKSLENDKARVSVGRISQFGLLEMSRQRIKAALTEGSYLTCPHCHGSGHLKSPEGQAVALLRKIHASAAKGQISRVEAQLPMDVAAHLLNYKREELVEMERRYQLQIHIHGNRDFVADQIEIETQKREKEKAGAEYIAAGMLPQDFEGAVTAAEQVKPEEKPRAEKPVMPTRPEAVPQPHEDTAAEHDEAEEAATSVGVEGAEPAKKRRRRKRRKPPAAGVISEAFSASGEDEADQPPAPSITAEAQPVALPAASDAEKPAAQETAAAKPKRRRSRRKSKPAASPAQADTAAAVADKPAVVAAAETTGQPTLEPPVVPPAAAEQAKTPAKRPRRSAKKPAAEATAPQPDQPAAAVAGEAAEAAGKPQARANRAKPAMKPARTAVVAESKSDQQPSPGPEAAAQKPARKAPARRTNAKSTARPAAATPENDAAATEKPAQATKPKRPRAVKKKPAAVEQE